MRSFEEFFEKATGYKPFPWQQRMALEGDHLPSLVSVPTGLGKTAGVILGWLWRRRFGDAALREAAPRRLVYCLPMRVLVEQTRDNALAWLQRLGHLASNAPMDHGKEEVAVHVLMGGDLEVDWDHWPERDQILIGTQDMLLSRALNRGYAMSRFRWPVQFGLLNNDCQWVMDEVQLMGNGLATSAQMQAFRRLLRTTNPARSTWMSATMRPEWLETIDFQPAADAPVHLALDSADFDRPEVHQRLRTMKPISMAPVSSSMDGKAEADLVMQRHSEAGGLTLVIVNTVKRARALHDAIKKQKPTADLLLVHSQFRPTERAGVIQRLLAPPGDAGTIAISTQVVEAGVDVSAKSLLTDLAPWASLVQRFGRCNRRGKMADAGIQWFDIDSSAKQTALPYDGDELEEARGILGGLTDAAPAALPVVSGERRPLHVLRRRDIVELFDTTTDLAGADIDVSRFIRETNDHAMRLFWREVTDAPSDEPAPQPEELCPVPVGEAREFAKKNALWRWDHLDRKWLRSSSIFPGIVLMASSRAGGYSPEVGWDAKSKRPVTIIGSDENQAEAVDDDRYVQRDWQIIADHTEAVVAEVGRLIDSCGLERNGLAAALELAARWHDAGKVHPVFQAALPDRDTEKLWAKAPSMARYHRKGFRHELASALAMLANGLPDLATYLAAAHHGKVRLSIRSLPHEQPPEDSSLRFARGIQEGDELAEVDLGGGVELPRTTLDLSYMELGDGPRGPSWMARMLALREEIGPFRLAYLEALLRIADWKASGVKGGAQ